MKGPFKSTPLFIILLLISSLLSVPMQDAAAEDGWSWRQNFTNCTINCKNFDAQPTHNAMSTAEEKIYNALGQGPNVVLASMTLVFDDKANENFDLTTNLILEGAELRAHRGLPLAFISGSINLEKTAPRFLR